MHVARAVRRVVAPGSRGPDVTVLQQRLTALRFDPGPVDGSYGSDTTAAVWAFQKLTGARPTGTVDHEMWAALALAGIAPPLAPGGSARRVEIDLLRQLLFVYDQDQLRLVSHVSTGSGDRFCDGGRCRNAVTPRGQYAFSWRWNGWRRSDLGLLYNPVYFHGGIAVHGALSVPLYPASHGCVRIPMHIAEYFPDLVAEGDPVYVV